MAKDSIMSDDRGYIRLYRKFFIEHEFWEEERVYSKAEAWIDLIHLAWYHKDKKLRKIDPKGSFMIEFGDVWASVRFLSERWRWSNGKVKRFLDYLEDRKSIVFKERNSNRTILNLVNLDFFVSWESRKGTATERQQNGDGTQGEQQQNSDGTQGEHSRNSNGTNTNQHKPSTNQHKPSKDLPPSDEGGSPESQKGGLSLPHKGNSQSYAYPEDFEQLWAIYGGKGDKGRKTDAFGEFQQRRKEGWKADQMIEAAKHYVQDCAKSDRPILHLRTFLHPPKNTTIPRFADYVQGPNEATGQQAGQKELTEEELIVVLKTITADKTSIPDDPAIKELCRELKGFTSLQNWLADYPWRLYDKYLIIRKRQQGAA